MNTSKRSVISFIKRTFCYYGDPRSPLLLLLTSSDTLSVETILAKDIELFSISKFLALVIA